MKIIFQFLFATFLFANGFRSANKIGTAVNVSPTRIRQWADTPLWTLALRCWGHRGTIQLNNHSRYRHRKNAGNVKALHNRRLNRQKDAMIKSKGKRKSGSLDLAEVLWKDSLFGTGEIANRFLRDEGEHND